VPVRLGGNALVSINVVTLHQSWLVSGWVTVFGRVNHVDAKPGTQPSLRDSLTSTGSRENFYRKFL